MRRLLPVAVSASCVLAACGSSGGHASTAAPRQVAAIQVISPAFPAGGTIPALYTCDGADISPPLRWSGIPPGARSLTLVMRDPNAPGGNFIHWSLTGIPPSTTEVPAGQVPRGTVQGRNGFGTVGYRGPCPPAGTPHHYVITLSSSGGEPAVGSLTGIYARR